LYLYWLSHFKYLLVSSVKLIHLIHFGFSYFRLISKRLEGVFVHPHRNIQVGIIEVLRGAHESMPAIWVVIEFALNTHTLQTVVIVVGLMRRYSVVFLTNQEHRRCSYVLNLANWRFLEDLLSFKWCYLSKIAQFFVAATSIDPIRDIC